jgi:hypothetical protein
MIQANELRIGNSTSKGVIKNILETGVHFGLGKCSTFRDLEPILLTEEILLNFGFEKVVEEFEECTNIIYELVIDTFTKIIIQSDFSFGLEDKDNPDESLCFTNDILKSVHRLQNLYFALKGEELTVKL